MKRELKRIGENATKNMANYNGLKQMPLNVVNFAGNGSPASEQQNSMNRNFKVTFKNMSEAAKDVLIYSVASDLDTLTNESWVIELVEKCTGVKSLDIIAGNDGVLNLGTESDPVNFEVTSDRFCLNALLTYLDRNPSRLMMSRISARNISNGSVNQEQFRTTIAQYIVNPFRAKQDVKEINLYQHFSLAQNQDGAIDVRDGFVWGPNSAVVWKILAGTEVSIDFQFGPILNTERALEQGVEKSGIAVYRKYY